MTRTESHPLASRGAWHAGSPEHPGAPRPVGEMVRVWWRGGSCVDLWGSSGLIFASWRVARYIVYQRSITMRCEWWCAVLFVLAQSVLYACSTRTQSIVCSYNHLYSRSAHLASGQECRLAVDAAHLASRGMGPTSWRLIERQDTGFRAALHSVWPCQSHTSKRFAPCDQEPHHGMLWYAWLYIAHLAAVLGSGLRQVCSSETWRGLATITA
jgi:hypothetical protein